jgi:phosphopantothenoylcysteine decarboxylase/phosphopantothenate--cysteine ligase
MSKIPSFLITLGATRELIDPVRYITNSSSGKMGFCLAEAAIKLGAKVTVIAGSYNVDIIDPDIEIINVLTADDMLQAVESKIELCDIFISCAAVCDYKVKNISRYKIKKSKLLSLELIETVDILKTISLNHPKVFTVGFAAETDNLLQYAKSKLINKKLNMIIANDVSDKSIGFNSDYNSVSIVTDNAIITLGRDTKRNISKLIIKEIYDSYLNYLRDNDVK